MNHPRIKRDPKIMEGKPVIAGTRITVEHIPRCLAAGESEAEIVGDYPPFTMEVFARLKLRQPIFWSMKV